MIEVRQVDTHTDGGTSDADACGLDKAHQLFLLDGFHEPRDNQEQDDEQIVIGHLHVVGIDLKGRENCREQQAPQIASLIG